MKKTAKKNTPKARKKERPKAAVDTYSTRFQGSKKRVIGWLTKEIGEAFPGAHTVLDAFTGTGVVAYALARTGREIIACDQLLSSTVAPLAFIGNRSALPMEQILKDIDSTKGEDEGFLMSNYKGVFFTDDEILWLEKAAIYANSKLDPDTRTAFLWCLFQSSLAKRPYNLFHRANLAMRQREVKRSFGNKATWDKSFDDHMMKFAKEHQKYALPDAPRPHVIQGNILAIPPQKCDLVYMDPPYVTSTGTGTPYMEFYGFLDLLCNPGLIKQIDTERPHKPLGGTERSGWERKATVLAAFEDLVDRYKDTAGIAISYRDEGYPSVKQLVEIVKRHKKTVKVRRMSIRYALSAATGASEILITGV